MNALRVVVLCDSDDVTASRARARDCDVDSERFGVSHFYTFYASERITRRLLAPERHSRAVNDDTR